MRSETVKMNTGTVQGYNTTATISGRCDRLQCQRPQPHRPQLGPDRAGPLYAGQDARPIEFGYARKTRSPNLYERYTWSTGGMAMNMINMVGDGNGYVGNLDLKPEVANTLSATADWHDAEQQNWGLKVTPYYTYVAGLHQCAALLPHRRQLAVCKREPDRHDRFVFLKYVNQDAHLYGLDVSGYFPLAQNTGFGSFTATGMLNYVRGEDHSARTTISTTSCR